MREQTDRESPPRFVVCVDNREYPASLELHKVYRALPDAELAADGDLRVIDESGEDYIFPAAYFLPIPLPHETEEALANSFAQGG